MSKQPPSGQTDEGQSQQAQAIDTWAAALDQFEQRLAGFRSTLEEDKQSVVTGMWPEPHLLGVPLPAKHVERARSLMAEAKRLEGEIISRRAELGPPRPTAQQHRRTPVSSFVTEL